MENKTINIGVVAEVAEALQELKEHVAFVGGSVISLYTDDPAADEVRPTGDIDMAVNIASFGEWNKMHERLGELGFHPDAKSDVICRYKYKHIQVDIMTTENVALGPVNRWYAVGFEDLKEAKAKEQTISLLAAPCFIATKLEAFNSRGNGDYRGSHDFEDVIYVIDNRTNIVQEISEAPDDIKAFIQEEIQKVLDHKHAEEYISAQLHPFIQEARYGIIHEKLTQICEN
jgi:predicted nucleotidyltransferase